MESKDAAEYRNCAWAVRPETLSAITQALRARAGSVPLEPGTLWVPGAPTVTTTAADSTGLLTINEAHSTLRTVETEGKGVAVIPLRGIVTPRGSFLSMLFGGGGGLEAFRAAFREALASDDVSAILFDIDSPGGSTDLVEEVATEIRESRGEKPITAIANTDACSAAYYLAAQADEVVVTPSGMAGSIGVFLLHWDESGFNEQTGFDPTYVYAGKFKVEGNPDEPLTDDARGALQAIVDDYYDLFVEAVAAGRGVAASEVRNGYGEGRALTARQALATGLADRVESYEATVTRLTGADAPSGRQVAEDRRAETRALQLAHPRRI